MQDPAARDVTQLLAAMGEGDQKAAGELLPLVYDELRKLAQARMARESAQTLQPTALVHEAYLRLVGDTDRAKWNGRGHFFGAAARAMRRIMVERARHQGRLKRGGDRKRVALDDNAVARVQDGDDLVALNDALDRLEAQDARKAQIVMLRYFAGLTIEETAAALDLSPAMIKKEWTVARAWLYRELARMEEPTAETG
jgi:RNA polymerase sigma factor (TIGR02999 family)